eukprot:TRINITY_DN668_c0_g2_i3.p1 TRINITY_DN668_c0_g2~~TRINITY_DN668_c0_g2_i3.p1  ORF type:complete len:325 (+),score=93.13 TRINITY_DN668_c0_g2_i3:624-1598(+)
MLKNKMPTLVQVALQIFDSEVVMKSIRRLVDNVFDQLMSEHAGEVIDRNSIKSAIKCFKMHKLLNARITKNEKGDLVWEGQETKDASTNDFDRVYITKYTEYFAGESKRWIVNMSSPEYAKKALEVLKREDENASQLLARESCKELAEKLIDIIVNQNASALVSKEHTGVKELIAQGRIEELNYLTKLIMKTPENIPLMTACLAEYVIQKGKSLEQDKKIVEDPLAYIKGILELKREVNSMISDAFESIKEFLWDSDKAFKNLLVEFELAPKFLAIYIDHMMRYELRGKESQTESLVSEVFAIFKLVNSKDVFCQQHQVLPISS